jgi:hypothetical protein
MAIQRLKSPYYITPVSTTTGAFAVRPLTGRTYDFEGNGSTNTIPGSRYRIHEFSANQSGVIQFIRPGYIDILIVAGGGWGGWGYYNNSTATNYGGGGGGAGGLLLQYNFYVDTTTSYGYSVGPGGIGNTGTNAGNSIFGPFTAIAGGRGGHTSSGAGVAGGSGGGGSYDFTSAGARVGGAGTIGQGNAGGSSAPSVAGAGGGGYSTVGSNTSSNAGASGGNGIKINFNGIDLLMCAGGGGGGWANNAGGPGGLVDGFIVGGYGGNSNTSAWQTFNGTNPIALGSGGGGGGTGSSTTNNGQQGGNGSNGIIMIRYVL